ncbi:MAG TPA: hypothetical protein VGH97_03535 [Thermoanaerobaculia bacterium]|jgi:hypothetical protein
MRFRIAILTLAAVAFAGALAAETFKNVSLIDSQCVDKVKSNPDKHTVKCALSCEDGGYGILTTDGKYLKFDADGNKKASAALQATKKTDHVRATVEGTVSGDQIKVSTLTLD